jgi:hypothetical protein
VVRTAGNKSRHPVFGSIVFVYPATLGRKAVDRGKISETQKNIGRLPPYHNDAMQTNKRKKRQRSGLINPEMD